MNVIELTNTIKEETERIGEQVVGIYQEVEGLQGEVSGQVDAIRESRRKADQLRSDCEACLHNGDHKEWIKKQDELAAVCAEGSTAEKAFSETKQSVADVLDGYTKKVREIQAEAVAKKTEFEAMLEGVEAAIEDLGGYAYRQTQHVNDVIRNLRERTRQVEIEPAESAKPVLCRVCKSPALVTTRPEMIKKDGLLTKVHDVRCKGSHAHKYTVEGNAPTE